MNFVEWLKTKLILILGILLALSIAGNVFLALKGLVINQYITTHSRSDSSANSASMSIGYIGGSAQGEWKIKYKSFRDIHMHFLVDEVCIFLNTLDPIQFLSAKITYMDSADCVVYYPEITPYKSTMTKGKEVTTYKEIKK